MFIFMSYFFASMKKITNFILERTKIYFQIELFGTYGSIDRFLPLTVFVKFARPKKANKLVPKANI